MAELRAAQLIGPVSARKVSPSGSGAAKAAITAQHGAETTLAARPAMGKTSLGLGMLVAAGKDLVARNEEGVCLFVSIEMPRVEIVRRLTSQLTGVTEAELKSPGSLPSETIDRVSAVANELAHLPIYIHDATYWLHDLKSLLYRMRLKHKRLRLVVIDYLQLMRAKLDRKESNREQEVDRKSVV